MLSRLIVFLRLEFPLDRVGRVLSGVYAFSFLTAFPEYFKW